MDFEEDKAPFHICPLRMGPCILLELPSAVAILDRSGHYRAVSEGFCDLLKFDALEIIQQHWSFIVVRSEIEVVREFFGLLSTSSSSFFSTKLNSKNGRIIWVNAGIHKVIGDDSCYLMIMEESGPDAIIADENKYRLDAIIEFVKQNYKMLWFLFSIVMTNIIMFIGWYAKSKSEDAVKDEQFKQSQTRIKNLEQEIKNLWKKAK